MKVRGTDNQCGVDVEEQRDLRGRHPHVPFRCQRTGSPSRRYMQGTHPDQSSGSPFIYPLLWAIRCEIFCSCELLPTACSHTCRLHSTYDICNCWVSHTGRSGKYNASKYHKLMRYKEVAEERGALLCRLDLLSGDWTRAPVVLYAARSVGERLTLHRWRNGRVC
ncbi:hypothetical protein BC826DRAFT_1000558 [Russula brevipes]|nr:hypothetical protein BC826DRAFT_1000558 [Russula brevipes]